MAGLSNAVNLTDGLDGLAGGCSMVVMLVMAMVAFNYQEVNLAIFAAAVAGCLGFLWHNCYPASIFMGDTGSLALGAAFAALAVLTKTEVTSLVMGGLFIAEALSVIVQVLSFSSRESACSSWPRCTTTSRRWAGPRPRSSSGSTSQAPAPQARSSELVPG